MSIATILRRYLLYPLWVYKNRSHQLRFLKKFEGMQWLDREELEKEQLINLKKIISHAYQKTSFYRDKFGELNFRYEKFNKITDIKNLPILTKAQIQENGDRLVANGFDKDSMIKYKTGGSTGKSLTIYGDLGRLDRNTAAAMLCYRWAGWDIGDPMGRIWGNPLMARSLKEKIKEFVIGPIVWLDTMDLNEKSMQEFIKQWNKIKPTLLHGHSHSLYEFAKFLRDNNSQRIFPQGIISTSMMLPSSERQVIEDVFKIKVIDLYGCEEVGLIACECEKNEGMHLNIFNLFIEFIKKDGSDAKVGEEGDIVITSLTNYGMPLIRYKIEDVGIPSDKSCSCGRGLPLMQKVSGRVADFLIKQDGSLVQGVSIIERTLTNIEGLNQMQIIQKDLNNIQLNVVKNQHYEEKSRLKLVGEFQNIFGHNVDISVNLVDRIKQEKSGKHRFSICEIKTR